MREVEVDVTVPLGTTPLRVVRVRYADGWDDEVEGATATFVASTGFSFEAGLWSTGVWVDADTDEPVDYALQKAFVLADLQASGDAACGYAPSEDDEDVVCWDPATQVWR